MLEQSRQEHWVDWYLRGKLSADDVEAFETVLLESPELQAELETALALRAVLSREPDQAKEDASQPRPLQPQSEPANWQPVALAASVILAVVGTVMWWKTGIDAAGLARQMHALSQPIAEVLTVPVPIMRSAGSQTPDVIIQKPQGRAAILLDIELGLRARQEAQLDFSLVDPAGETVLSWQSGPGEDGRATAVINSDQIPASRLWLHIADAESEVLERRLLEFRAKD